MRLFLPLLCALALLQPVARAADSPLPPASDYVVVNELGQLSVNGQRQRYWGVIGGFPDAPQFAPTDTPEQRAAKLARARADADAIVERFVDLGFNFIRFWRVTAADPGATPYVQGDGSPSDLNDYFLARAKARGLRVWTAGLNRVGAALPADVAILDEPATAEAWREAVAAAAAGQKRTGWDLRNNPARVWDPRLQALALERMRRIADHRNPYTGLRWADDPLFAVWELSNEEWWVRRMLSGRWQQLPPFFKNQLVARWNAYLVNKYATDDALRTAWAGLLPGESLAAGSVLFAPMARAVSSRASLNDANPDALAAVTALKQDYSRDDFAPARASDVLEFLVGLQQAHKQKEAAALKSWGRSTALSPLIWDTGIGYEIQSQYLHQQADAVAHDAYLDGWGQDRGREAIDAAPDEFTRARATLEHERRLPNSGKWINWLLRPPGISLGVPWLEHNRVAGKPFLCYETQIQQPAKYRADFPLRLLTLAAIQDWDVICWHYWGRAPDASTEGAFDRPMDVTKAKGGHLQGYHFTYDEVQSAVMRQAAHLFRNGALKTAPHPTTFVYGRRSLHDPASMDYAGSYGLGGLDMLQTTYQHGVRIQIDPTREDDEVRGPVVKFADRWTHNPYTPTDEIVIDWKKGHLSLDAPGGMAWAGLLARHGERVEFRHGVTLSEVELINPPGSPDPVTDEEKYVAFALATEDGRPLAESARASLTLMSTSFNTGFVQHANGAAEIAGGLPVLVTRVGARIESDALDGMTYVFRDWHLKELARGRIAGGVLTVPATLPIFYVELTR